MRSHRLFPILIFAGSLSCALVLPARAAVPAGSPASLVAATSSQIITALDRNKVKIHKNPELIKQLIDKYLLPHFDFAFTSQLVLGRYWRLATPSQRQAFEKVFLRYLVNTYANALKNYSGARVEVLPFRGDAAQRFVKVRSRIIISNREPIAVDYALKKTTVGWKVFDVIIAGVSYVQTYADEFRPEVQRTGIEALIERLRRARAPQSLTAPAAATSGGRQ